VARAGSPPELVSEMLVESATILADVQRLPEALARADAARVLLEGVGARSRGSRYALPMVDALTATAVTRVRNRQAGDALAPLDDARGLLVDLLGEDHPRLVEIAWWRSEALRMLGRNEESLAAMQVGLRIHEARQPGTAAHADTLSQVGGMLNELARPAEAIELMQRAVAIGRRVLPAHDVQLALLLTRLADSLRPLRRTDEAIALYDEALAAFAKSGVVTRHVAITFYNRADAHRSARRCEDAVRDYRRAAELFDEVLGPGSVFRIAVAFGIGQCLIDLERAADAIPYLETALAVESAGFLTDRQAYDRFLLGRILVDTGRDRARGQALVVQARREVEALGAAWAPALEEIDAWAAAGRRGRRRAPRRSRWQRACRGARVMKKKTLQTTDCPADLLRGRRESDGPPSLAGHLNAARAHLRGITGGMRAVRLLLCRAHRKETRCARASRRRRFN
jgi:tetratricopeptide (TPR) repeat protein